MWGQFSIVGIATYHGLESPGIESQWGLYFLHPCRPALGPPGLLINAYRVKWLGCAFDHPPPYCAEVKERVELYIYSPSVPSGPVVGWNLPFFYLSYAKWSLWYAVHSCNCDRKLTITSQHMFISGSDFDPNLVFLPSTWWYSQINCN